LMLARACERSRMRLGTRTRGRRGSRPRTHRRDSLRPAGLQADAIRGSDYLNGSPDSSVGCHDQLRREQRRSCLGFWTVKGSERDKQRRRLCSGATYGVACSGVDRATGDRGGGGRRGGRRRCRSRPTDRGGTPSAAAGSAGSEPPAMTAAKDTDDGGARPRHGCAAFSSPTPRG